MNIALDKVVRLCLVRIGRKLEVQGVFVRTFFVAPYFVMVANKSKLN